MGRYLNFQKPVLFCGFPNVNSCTYYPKCSVKKLQKNMTLCLSNAPFEVYVTRFI